MFSNFLNSFRKQEPKPVLESTEPLNIRFYTHNIRYDNNGLWENEKPWNDRKTYVASSIKFNSRNVNTVVTLQEVLHNQVEDLTELLGEDWSYYGVGREDGLTKGEYSPIFYKNTDWKLLESKTFWLSETPDKPSKGWDAALERIVSWVHLEHKHTGIKVNVFSTHFDHQGVVARKESTKLIISKTKSINSSPSFFGGDFNTEPTDEPYKIASKHLLDARKEVHRDIDRYGHYEGFTYTGFDGGIVERAKVLDYLWVDKKDTQNDKGYSLKVEDFAVLHSEFNGVYMSDHRPVVADVLLYPKATELDDKNYVILFKPREEDSNKVLAI